MYIMIFRVCLHRHSNGVLGVGEACQHNSHVSSTGLLSAVASSEPVSVEVWSLYYFVLFFPVLKSCSRTYCRFWFSAGIHDVKELFSVFIFGLQWLFVTFYHFQFLFGCAVDFILPGSVEQERRPVCVLVCCAWSSQMAPFLNWFCHFWLRNYMS